MKKAVWFAICLGLLGTPALGQQSAVIRAGEHPTYSRLVIPSANSLDWELRTSGRQARLTLPTKDVAFLTDQIFDRIPRTRLLDAEIETSENGSVLSLRLACDCEVAAMVEGNSIILDIKSPDDRGEAITQDLTDSAPPPRPEQTSSDAERLTQQPPIEGSDLAARLLSQLNKAAEQGIIELNEVPETEDQKTDIAQEAGTMSSDQPSEPTEEDAVSLDPTEMTLDGLEAVGDRLEGRIAQSIEAAGLSDSVRVTIPEELVVPEQVGNPVKDRSDGTQDEAVSKNAFCVDDEFLDVAYWADQRPYSDQVAQLQARVFGEFDKPDEEATLHLARFYIYFGLGTEAKALLSDLGIDELQANLLAEVANTVEGSAHTPGGALDRAAGCEGAVSLWRTAAIDTGETQPVPNEDEIIEIFSEYPIEVRRIIGPRLIQSFLTRGQSTAASRIFAIVERAAGYHGDQHELRRADLLRLEGQTEDAEAQYWALVHDNSIVTADAAKSLVDSILSRGSAVPDNVIAVIEALAFEYRGTQTGTDLLLAAISARAGSKNISEALSIATQEIDANPEEAQSYFEAIDNIIPEASPNLMGAMDYTKLIYQNFGLLSGPEISNNSKFDISQKLLDIGLPNAALRMVGATRDADPSVLRPLLARASFKLGAQDEVLRLWDEDRDNTALSSLASRALSSLGRHEEALQSAALSGDQEIHQLAWHAGDWERSADSPDLFVQVLSQYMLDRGRPIAAPSPVDPERIGQAVANSIEDEGEVTLSYARSVQEQSEAVRAFLQDALGQM